MTKSERAALFGIGAVAALGLWAYWLQKRADAVTATGAVPVSTFQYLNGAFPGIGLVPLFADPTLAQMLREQPVKS